uniref:Calponin-homology (CH) domain-containing protein n=1 Tax=Kryptolebias marmoratus TaxID=37003 RepID=A0A3Q3EIH8_KRYMA
MAGRGREDWFEREEFIGQISDIRVQNLQVEREGVQKRTFTRWMNLHLEKCKPPLQVQDLFQDIQDGHVLMALLEELSGCKLVRLGSGSSRVFKLPFLATR